MREGKERECARAHTPAALLLTRPGCQQSAVVRWRVGALHATLPAARTALYCNALTCALLQAKESGNDPQSWLRVHVDVRLHHGVALQGRRWVRAGWGGVTREGGKAERQQHAGPPHTPRRPPPSWLFLPLMPSGKQQHTRYNAPPCAAPPAPPAGSSPHHDWHGPLARWPPRHSSLCRLQPLLDFGPWVLVPPAAIDGNDLPGGAAQWRCAVGKVGGGRT